MKTQNENTKNKNTKNENNKEDKMELIQITFNDYGIDESYSVGGNSRLSFFYDRGYKENLKNILNIIDEFYNENYIADFEQINEDTIKDYLKSYDMDLYIEIVQGYIYNDLAEGFEVFEVDEYLKDYEGIILEYFDQDMLFDYITDLGYYIGVVGDCYYITIDEESEKFAVDMINNDNMYGIDIVGENLEYIESLAYCYISNTEELIEFIKDNFGIEKNDIKLLRNNHTLDASYMFDDLPTFVAEPKTYELVEVGSKF